MNILDQLVHPAHFYNYRDTINNLKSDAAALEISGCDDFKATDCYFDTKVAPIVSAGTSKGITFTNCLTPTGKTVSVKK